MPLYNPPIVTALVEGSTACNPTVVSPPATITDAKELIAANPNRKGLAFWNNSTGYVKIQKGAAPTATSFYANIAPNGYFEFPQPIWRGAVQGLWSAAGGTGVNVSEDI